MSMLMLVVRNEKGNIKSAVKHYSTIASWMQDDGVEPKKFAGMDFVYSNAVYPVDAGIVVVDFKTKQIFDCQSGFGLFNEYYMKGEKIPKDRKIIKKIKGCSTVTNSPKMEKLVKSGWNVIDYRKGGYGFGLTLHWLQNDLKEAGIEVTDGEKWWDYFNRHYAWANIPFEGAYTPDHSRLLPFSGLTNKQSELLEILKKKADKDNNGNYTIPWKGYTDIDIVMRSLNSKYHINSRGGGGSVWENKMTYRYKIFVQK